MEETKIKPVTLVYEAESVTKENLKDVILGVKHLEHVTKGAMFRIVISISKKDYDKLQEENDLACYLPPPTKLYGYDLRIRSDKN